MSEYVAVHKVSLKRKGYVTIATQGKYKGIGITKKLKLQRLLNKYYK